MRTGARGAGAKASRGARNEGLDILICTQEFPPRGSGIAYVAKNAADALRRRGHKVTVCSPDGPDIARGSEWLIRKTGGLGLLWFWRGARRACRAASHDVIWTHNPLFLRRTNGGRFVHTVHTTYLQRRASLGGMQVSPLFRLYNAAMGAVERWCYTRVRDGTFTVTSRLTAEEIRKLGVEKPPTLIRNGVDTARFRPSGGKGPLRRELGIPLRSRVFLNVGRMMPQKRQGLLIRRFGSFAGPTDILIIIGDGPLRREIEWEAARSGRRIILAGRMAQESLLKYYQAADYFIMPSTYEGQPLSLLEATACGLIPILSAIPVFEDFIAETGIGLLVDFEGDRSPLSIKRYVEMCDREGCSKRLAAHMRRHYDWRRIAGEYERLFLARRDESGRR